MTESPLPSSHPYTLRGIRQMLGLSRHAISKLIQLGFVEPLRGPGRVYRFSFRDVVLLRSAHELREARIPTRKILRSLRSLRNALPPDMPIGGLRITAAGDRITVRQDDAQWEPETGQLVMDFSVSPAEGNVSFISQRAASEGAARANMGAGEGEGHASFEQAEELEETDPAAAERMYRHLIADEPSHADAYLNLGFMLCEAARWQEAVALYAAAVIHCADDPLVHYNLAVALEALGRTDQALESYEACLRLQPDLADAHQNAALLYAQSGQKQLAIRHFSAYRRLQGAT